MFRRIFSEHTEPVYRGVFERYGGAIASMDLQFVNGALYRRLVPLIAPDRDKGKIPPNPVLWLVTRLHPEFRRRDQRAKEVIEQQVFVEEIDRWMGTERFEWIEACRTLQAFDVDTASDAELADHLRHLDERLIAGWYRHHELHAADLGPIGDLLVHAKQWGLDPTDVMTLLRGASPATVEAARHGSVIAAALSDNGTDPSKISTIDEIRAVPAAAAALDEYLAMFGWRLISDYDITGLTLNELPSAVVAIVRKAATDDVTDTDTAERDRQTKLEALRDEADDPALFDELVASARLAYGVRDDNGPLTWAWPAGLTRRAYLEAGRRLTAGNRLPSEEHVFEFDIPELASTLDGGVEPSVETLVERAETRRWEATLDSPDVLGPPPAEPDLAPLPPNIRRMMAITLATVSMLEPELDQTPVALHGLGIGERPYTGTARVVDDAATAIAEVQPGDVLVAAWTAPSFNAVFSIAGGVVVQAGGLLCHAAVMARELDIPGVIGCTDAMTEISSGDLIEVDPAAGLVTVVRPA